MFEANLNFDNFYQKCEFNQENYQCPSGFKVKSICVEKKCENSCFICENEKCLTCSRNHSRCNLRFTVDMFAKTVNKNLERQKKTAL